MTTTPRGGGREAMIAATIDVLREGREVRVLDIAETAGVSHSLIYRHFPDGGREELIAEAFARIFRGAVDSDLEELESFTGSDEEIRQKVVGLLSEVLSPERAPQRWARLEALSAARTNNYLAERIEETKAELIDAFTSQLEALGKFDISPENLRAFATLSLAIPLGLTAMMPVESAPGEGEPIAAVWADLTTRWLFAQVQDEAV